MAAVFTFAFLLVAGALIAAVVAYVAHRRDGGGRINRYLPPIVLVGILLGFLLLKFAYEEVYPCVAIDSFYCDFDSTQYHNLFGWEF